ncbi:type II toxin-antitoxin system HipA family toxin [Piscinibacter gummiphilus]|uniref:Type II toxin-antitoxin system HipA family toxin n=1 Tax=Piscinibacter gummiphilus TaxID=946333 RepID=A0ABZ0CUH5_9BURK|nr:type II toxin-antitoxin system HipA family toxin [Piscinibacter gummiphilus]WOB08628.1 type II toxin-antitoxin system HipA family toxin [Piscinibacter gummiphilus]
MSSHLAAWMNGELVGRWAVERGTHRFTYDEAWLRSPRCRALSLSLPITPGRELRGPAVQNYFDNLLPDNERIRQRLQRRFKTGSADAFALLEAIGRDCVGAVQLLPDGTPPTGWDRIDSEALSEAQVAATLRAVPSEAVLGQAEDDETFRISLAGAQEKTALLRHHGRWHRPLGATPTTHILKLPLGLVGGSRRVDLGDSVENEWLCALVLHHLGLPVAPAEIWRFEDQKVLAVTRFDRAWQQEAGGHEWIARLPQEDFCQALGQAPSRKYEKDGGPGIADCLRLLAGSREPQDRARFALTQLAFWLMAATDGHAKNYSLFLHPGDAYVMTPLYDVLSIFPYMGDAANQFRWRKAELAFALRAKNVHYQLHSQQPRHWHALAMQAGGTPVWARMLEQVARVGPALDAVEHHLPADYPPRTWQAISSGMRAQAARFEAGLEKLPFGSNQ